MARDSTGLKLEITFGCLIALLVGVGWLGLSRMGEINASTNRLFNERWLRLHTARQASSYFVTNNRILSAFLLADHRTGQEAAELAARISANSAKGDAGWRQIESAPVSDAERELVRGIGAAKAPAEESLKRLMTMLAGQGDTRETRRIMVSETLPLLNRYHDAWTELNEYEEEQMNRAIDDSKSRYAGLRRLCTTLVLIAIGFAIGIAVYVTQKLRREMAERERAQLATRALNEELEQKVALRTEELRRTVETLKEEVSTRRAREEDNRRLANIVECTDDAIIAADLNGIITDWNGGAERMLGYSRREIIGQPLSAITPADRSREPLECRDKLVRGDSFVRLETLRLKKDGKAVHVAISISPLKDPSGRLIGGSGIFRDISDRKMMEEIQRRSEESFRSIVQNAPFGIVRTTQEGRILQANPALVEMLGYESEREVLGLMMGTDVYRDPRDREEATRWVSRQDSVEGLEVEWKHKSGRPFTIRCTAHVVRDADGNVEFLEGFIEDISERRALEQQLRQGQKMEAIGRLAGGVAHDFNNLLGVISGYAELAAEQVDSQNGLHNPIQQIQKAADRAASLTRQLLAFSRQQVLETKILNLNGIVEDMSRMLPRLLGEDIELKISLDPAAATVKADQGQIEQVILNLAVNARDAMPGGGQLSISTKAVRSDTQLFARHPSMQVGEYVLLSVADTGTGMDKQTQAHIFEPFFTTKERGRGTGLGLAMVYGFVKQSGGYVWVESEPGAGSSFDVYLPVVAEADAPKGADPAAATLHSAGGTILLVEDEDSLRTLTRSILEQSGYTVMEARNGAEAVELAREYRGAIHLLLTDMVMPGMNGRAVAERVGQLHPGTRIVYMSGYTGFNDHESVSLNGVIISKPFTRATLLQKLSETLELETKPA